MQAVLTAMPGASLAAMRRGHRKFGPDNQTVLQFPARMDSRTLFLTANTAAIYNFIWLNTKEGPLVIEMPPNGLGAIDDFWFRWVGDLGVTSAGNVRHSKRSRQVESRSAVFFGDLSILTVISRHANDYDIAGRVCLGNLLLICGPTLLDRGRMV